jgi:hypothetical protein
MNQQWCHLLRLFCGCSALSKKMKKDLSSKAAGKTLHFWYKKYG